MVAWTIFCLEIMVFLWYGMALGSARDSSRNYCLAADLLAFVSDIHSIALIESKKVYLYKTNPLCDLKIAPSFGLEYRD